MRLLKWLYPGLKIKRWGSLSILGIVLIIAGSWAHWWDFILGFALNWQIRIPIIVLGVLLIVLSTREMIRSIIGVFLPQREKELVDIIFTHRHLSKGPKIVAIGGGTGLPVLLSGLKEYTSNITAVVTVSDDGGSSGRLRKNYGMLPAGDIRNCLVALADTETLMRELFQFRFEEGSEFNGHSFGNIFITAMTEITGDFEMAIRQSSKVLAIRGRVLPSSLDKVTLIAEHIDGSRTIGESSLDENSVPIKAVSISPPDCKPAADVLEAILAADAIILGPGSLYTSILPNLLIKGIVDAVYKSSAMKIYVCNVMTEHRETANYTASDHIKAIVKHTMPSIIKTVVLNTGKIPAEVLSRYREEDADIVVPDVENIISAGYRVIEKDLIDIHNCVRHNPNKLGAAIFGIIKDRNI